MVNSPIVLAITGASGALYGVDIFDRLSNSKVEIHLIITDTAEAILSHELGLKPDYFKKPNVTIHDNSILETSIASGSFMTAGMVVAPCSMGCLGRIAGGISIDLVGRAADVTLKERRPLILVPRETPLSPIHLENMLKLSRAGATILPAMPAFTHRPSSMKELSAFITGRVFDQLKIKQDFAPVYKGKQ